MPHHNWRIVAVSIGAWMGALWGLCALLLSYGNLKGQTFRIGHMGDHTEESLAELLAFADDAVKAQR